MEQHSDWPAPQTMASEIDAQVRALPIRNASNIWAIRRQYSRQLREAKPEFVLELAKELVLNYGHRCLPYALILHHREAFQSLGEGEVEELGSGINSWGSVDCFARQLSGPAWLKGRISDELIHRWAHSEDLWWRRAALVSTVALNVKASGGSGDAARTLEVCRILVDDHSDMVVKALSWALRELVPHAPEAVREFLAEYEESLAARVKREVKNKLSTGLKNPKQKPRRVSESTASTQHSI